jgi:hypothetical protein
MSLLPRMFYRDDPSLGEKPLGKVVPNTGAVKAAETQVVKTETSEEYALKYRSMQEWTSWSPELNWPGKIVRPRNGDMPIDDYIVYSDGRAVGEGDVVRVTKMKQRADGVIIGTFKANPEMESVIGLPSGNNPIHDNSCARGTEVARKLSLQAAAMEYTIIRPRINLTDQGAIDEFVSDNEGDEET